MAGGGGELAPARKLQPRAPPRRAGRPGGGGRWAAAARRRGGSGASRSDAIARAFYIHQCTTPCPYLNFTTTDLSDQIADSKQQGGGVLCTKCVLCTPNYEVV